MANRQWEYFFRELRHDDAETLRQMGAEGWELVSVTYLGVRTERRQGPVVAFYFKREVSA